MKAVFVVIDETQASKLVHERTDARASRANHLGEHLLADLGDNGLRLCLFAEIRQQQQKPCQTLLAGVKELVDQVRFHAHVPRQKIGNEQLRERGFLVEHPDHDVLFQPGNRALGHSRGRGHAMPLPNEASLAKEMAGPENRDNRLLSVLGDDGDFDLALVDIENSVGRIALGKYGLPLDIAVIDWPSATLARNVLGSNATFFSGRGEFVIGITL